ncbi:NAC domain-containing protein 60 [Morus notabilis]|uniref:NAC domain-containing protein 60 n=1 Tax=Morus notabilis TaxID=981085 RepID=UPI000CED262B|nr:NAC domain-containing protein 60 [Morus notabilis]XP_024028455.1 NAC domain-containing protein 60 [Morus notabilis]
MSLSVPRNLPPGYRFRPTDEELMNHFLRLKMIRGCSDVDDDIAEVDDVCMWDPWELRLKSKIESDDQISWFFSRRDPKNKRTKRKTKTGFWKITGKEQEIKGRDGRVIGKKKIVVFLTGPTPGRGTDWVIHEYHPLPENVLPNQSYYVICRLENKAVEKAGPPGCDDSEPSCDITSDVENSVASAAISEVHGQAEGNAELLPQHFQYHDIASDVENSVASVAISEVHGQAEGNAESLPQQVLSSDDCFLTDEEINFLNACLDNDHTQLMPEHHPETENSLLHQRPDITHCLESKTDENAGTLGCNIGKPSSDIRAETENSVAHPAISEVSGHGERNAKLLSQPVLSLDDCLTMEDLTPSLSDSFNDGQKSNWVMHEHRPELENSLPQQWPYLTCCLENKTDEYVGSLDCNIGRPSSDITSDIENQVAHTAIPVGDGHTEVNAESCWQTFSSPDYYYTEEAISLIRSYSLCDDHNNSHALCGSAEPIMCPAEFPDGRKADLYENYNGETANNLSNDFIQPKSLKRPYFPDIPASNDTNAEGVDGWVKRPRSLALGE